MLSPPIKSQLNPVQRTAIEHDQGPLLILAGAGSGKTRVITERMIRLIRDGLAAPWNIAALTFTNKAAAEMRSRVEENLGERGKRVCIRTFHSLALAILRRHGEQIGLVPNFSIADRSIQKSLIKKILKELRVDSKQFEPNRILFHIDRARDQLLTPDQYLKNYQDTLPQIDTNLMHQIHSEYLRELQANQSLDYGALLYYCAQLLEKEKDVRIYYQQLWKYLMIDEYQDTNHAQYQIGKYLSSEHKNIMVVGDEDQSIYSWRGADIRNILDFTGDYPQAKILQLEENYRSSKRILQLANQVIAKNTQRHSTKKKLFTNNADGEMIQTNDCESDYQETEWVVSQIQRDIIEDGVLPKDIAIFYRINAQSRMLEQQLRQSNIPYMLIGDIRFFERKEIKDMLAILQVLCNPSDSLSLTRILNVPPRGLGQVALNRLTNHANKLGISLYQALQQADRIPNFRAAASAKKMSLLFEKWRTFPYESMADVLQDILKDTNYIDSLSGESPLEKAQRASNINELLSILKDLESETRVMINIDIDSGDEDDRALSASVDAAGNVNAASNVDAASNHALQRLDMFLKSISLDTGEQSEEVSADRCIRLMTLHNAKGLEFKRVWIVGVEEGYLPHSLSIQDEDQIEEERRLFYVGITRAMEKLSLSHVQQRYIFGMRQLRDPSRFLTEVEDGSCI